MSRLSGRRLPGIAWRSVIAICTAFAVAIVIAHALTPRSTTTDSAPDLAQALPSAFGDWTEVPATTMPVAVAVTNAADVAAQNRADTVLYDQVVMRTYRHRNGDQMALSLAWGSRQRQEYKIHRPELCYGALGFDILELKDTAFAIFSRSGGAVRGQEMLAKNGSRLEAVTFWIRLGDAYSQSAAFTRRYIFWEGIKGRIHDGILVRASQLIATPELREQSYSRQKQFLGEMVDALDPRARALLVN